MAECACGSRYPCGECRRQDALDRKQEGFDMPLTEKGETIKAAMEKQYGAEKGESVFYASKNAGTIAGVDAPPVSKDENMTPNGPLPERQTGSTPDLLPWGGLPQQVTQEETVARVNSRSPWL